MAEDGSLAIPAANTLPAVDAKAYIRQRVCKALHEECRRNARVVVRFDRDTLWDMFNKDYHREMYSGTPLNEHEIPVVFDEIRAECQTVGYLVRVDDWTELVRTERGEFVRVLGVVIILSRLPHW